MYDTHCPYCDSELEINHDDGYGYEEDRRHEQRCGVCEKIFTFITSIHFSYEAEKADCLNVQPHKMKKVCGSAQDIWPDWKRCEDCDYEVRGEYKSPKNSEAKG